MSEGGCRFRAGRTTPRVLRQTISDTYAAADHQAPPDPPEVASGGVWFIQGEYDDGNGMWIHGVAP